MTFYNGKEQKDVAPRRAVFESGIGHEGRSCPYWRVYIVIKKFSIRSTQLRISGILSWGYHKHIMLRKSGKRVGFGTTSQFRKKVYLTQSDVPIWFKRRPRSQIWVWDWIYVNGDRKFRPPEYCEREIAHYESVGENIVMGWING